MIKLIILLIYSLVLSGCTFVQNPPITDFDSCAASGKPIMESYPPRCTANGQTYTQDIGNELEMQYTIRVSSPRPGTKITSPLTITGEARGKYFFEAQFPIRLLDQDHKIIAQGVAEAESDWMTENFVPFTATLTFTTNSSKGTLVLENDNPSDNPSTALELLMPVRF